MPNKCAHCIATQLKRPTIDYTLGVSCSYALQLAATAVYWGFNAVLVVVPLLALVSVCGDGLGRAKTLV